MGDLLYSGSTAKAEIEGGRMWRMKAGEVGLSKDAEWRDKRKLKQESKT